MVRHVKVNKSGSSRDSLPEGQGADHQQMATPARGVHIPAMYMRPLGDRGLHGCLKSRA